MGTPCHALPLVTFRSPWGCAGEQLSLPVDGLCCLTMAQDKRVLINGYGIDSKEEHNHLVNLLSLLVLGGNPQSSAGWMRLIHWR